MDYKITAAGWFKEIAGHPVVKLDCSRLSHLVYAEGHPIGILLHYTAGSGDLNSLAGLYRGQGFVEAQLATDRRGRIGQFTPITMGGHHAHEAGEHLLGIENCGNPPAVPFDQRQRDLAAAICAAVVAEVKKRFGFEVPLRHVPGCSITTPGLKEHNDGTINSPGVNQPCSWNPGRHVDNPVSVWGDGVPAKSVNVGWDEFLADIDSLLNGGVDALLEGEEEMAILSDQDQKDLKAFLDAARKALGTQADPTRPAKPSSAGTRLGRAARRLEKGLPLTGSTR